MTDLNNKEDDVCADCGRKLWVVVPVQSRGELLCLECYRKRKRNPLCFINPLLIFFALLFMLGFLTGCQAPEMYGRLKLIDNGTVVYDDIVMYDSRNPNMYVDGGSCRFHISVRRVALEDMRFPGDVETDSIHNHPGGWFGWFTASNPEEINSRMAKRECYSMWAGKDYKTTE
jgi:hypothetical protein